jgi:hypothetical protein
MTECASGQTVCNLGCRVTNDSRISGSAKAALPRFVLPLTEFR